MTSSSKYEFAKAKAGCEGCIFENNDVCPAALKTTVKGVYLAPPEERICYDKEKDEELIIIKEV